MQQVLSEKENKMQSDKCNYCSFTKKKDLEVASWKRLKDTNNTR